MSASRSPHSGAALVLSAAMLWGTTGTAQALAPAGATPLAVGALRLISGGAFLLLLAWGRGQLKGNGRWPILPTLLAAMSMAAYQLFFFAAVLLTGVAVGTVVAVGSSPILAGLLLVVFWRQRPSSHWLLATALAIGGVILLAGGGEVAIHPGGLALALATGLSYAVYVLATKRLLADQPAERATAVVFGLGALALTPILFLSDLRWLAQPGGMLVVLHLGVVTIGLAYLLFAQGLTAVPAATAVTLSLAEPLTAALLGIFFIGERLPASGFAGVGLLFLGLLWLARSHGH